MLFCYIRQLADWRSHFKTLALNHQLCTAHLLRELTYFIEVYKDPWAIKCRQLIRDALRVEKNMKHDDYFNNYQPKNDIFNRLDKLLEACEDEKKKDLVAFKKRLITRKDYLFNFLVYPDVPPDNNGSERAIRNIKAMH